MVVLGWLVGKRCRRLVDKLSREFWFVWSWLMETSTSCWCVVKLIAEEFLVCGGEGFHLIKIAAAGYALCIMG